MKLNKGFTLIELIVVMAVFLFIVGAAMGIFISIITSQRRVLAEQQFLNQISYVEEYMSKALRAAKTAKVTESEDIECLGEEGNIYKLTHWDGAIGAHTGIKFINANNDDNICQEFYLSGGVLYEKKGVDSLVEIPLISSNLSIQSIKFVINGVIDQTNNIFPGETTSIQPKVTILLNITVPGETQPRIIQTTVSRRTLNVVQ